MRASVGVGATEVRATARAIDPAGPVFITAIEKPAVRLGLSKATAMNISDGAQATATVALTAPTAYGLTQDDAGPGLTAAVNCATGGANVINGTGSAIEGSGKSRIVAGLLGAGSAVATGVWGAGR